MPELHYIPPRGIYAAGNPLCLALPRRHGSVPASAPIGHCQASGEGHAVVSRIWQAASLATDWWPRRAWCRLHRPRIHPSVTFITRFCISAPHVAHAGVRVESGAVPPTKPVIDTFSRALETLGLTHLGFSSSSEKPVLLTRKGFSVPTALYTRTEFPAADFAPRPKTYSPAMPGRQHAASRQRMGG
jgi:hypothetical protein